RMREPRLVLLGRRAPSNQFKKAPGVLCEVLLSSRKLFLGKVQINLASIVGKDCFSSGYCHAFDHQRHMRRAKLGRGTRLWLLKQEAEMIEREKLVSDRNTGLFARVT